MKYTMSFASCDYDQLTQILFADRTVERAAYLLCAMSVTASETRLLVQEIHPVQQADIISQSECDIQIRPESFMRVLKRAASEEKAFVFVHSHPQGFVEHSSADDKTEPALFKTAHVRIPGAYPHASLVFSDPELPRGRVWLSDGSCVPLTLIRSIGDRFRFYYADAHENDLDLFDRQVRAFGPDIQDLLGRLHVGVVGVGGTGSCTAEQLIRLGVGEISVFDGDRLDQTNVSRVYGSRVVDAKQKKVDITKRLAEGIGLPTKLNTHYGNISSEALARSLRDCDIIFGCTDDEWGRSILNKIAVGYIIPLLDMGVKIDSDGGSIRSVQGRVTTIIPNSPCLLCRQRITADVISAEVMAFCDPEGSERLVKEGYLANLPTSAPAVIAFTTATAAAAVSEFLHRLTGFMGRDRTCTETIMFFDQSCVRTNGGAPADDCFCGRKAEIGSGDQIPFLGSIWLK